MNLFLQQKRSILSPPIRIQGQREKLPYKICTKAVKTSTCDGWCWYRFNPPSTTLGEQFIPSFIGFDTQQLEDYSAINSINVPSKHLPMTSMVSYEWSVSRPSDTCWSSISMGSAYLPFWLTIFSPRSTWYREVTGSWNSRWDPICLLAITSFPLLLHDDCFSSILFNTSEFGSPQKLARI